jgi:hypothetical protein
MLVASKTYTKENLFMMMSTTNAVHIHKEMATPRIEKTLIFPLLLLLNATTTQET